MRPLWILAMPGTLYGFAAFALFRRVAKGPAILAAMKRIQAHLLEFWLFVDEPRAIWKSWKGLLAANARLLGLLFVPFLLIAIPSVPLFLALNGFYGPPPLSVGTPAVVTVPFDGPPNTVPDLVAPGWISVESPPLLVPSLHEVSWRIRPLRALSGRLQWVSGSTKFSRRVTVLDDRYTDVHWSVWFLGFSLVGALIGRYVIRSAPIRSRG
jgi:hypothetical protein